MTRAICIVLLMSWLAACGGTQIEASVADEPPRELADARALEIIEEVLVRNHEPASRGWDVDVNASRALSVDVRINASEFGIEYVTTQDRADMGEVIPEADPDGQLRIMRGARADSHAQILVLDSKSYLYDDHIEHVQQGAAGIRDAEGRLARDVEDFVAYARGQGLN